MAESKFVKGMLIGAIVGGALTLFDKETRQSLVQKGQAAANYVKHPKETYQTIQAKLENAKQVYQDLNKDLQFLAEKAAELKEVGGEATKIVEETKKAFEKGKNHEGGEEDLFLH